MKHILGVWRMVAGLVFFLLLLEGCISVPRSPSPHFYTLESIEELDTALAGAESLSDVTIGIGPVALPAYLRRPQIATKSEADTIEFAQFERWAESLDEEIARVITRNFAILFPKAGVEIFPWNSIIPVKYQVIIEVIQLDSKLNSDVVLLVQWSVLDAKEKKMLLSKRSGYRKSVETHDYPGLVQSVSAICESLSREIAQALTQLPSQNPLILR